MRFFFLLRRALSGHRNERPDAANISSTSGGMPPTRPILAWLLLMGSGRKPPGERSELRKRPIELA